MALADLDPRNGGACSNFLAKKFLSYIMAYLQLILWVCSLITIIFNPSALGTVVKKSSTLDTVFAVLIMLFSIGFSVLLLIGLHKGRRLFVKSYCIFEAVHLMLLALSFVVNIFLQPGNLGFRGFFSIVLSFFLQGLFLLVVKSYYLITYCNGSKKTSILSPV